VLPLHGDYWAMQQVSSNARAFYGPRVHLTATVRPFSDACSTNCLVQAFCGGLGTVWRVIKILLQLIFCVRADSGLVVLTLKLLLVIDGNDVVTCVDIDTIKNLKRVSECEVRRHDIPAWCALPVTLRRFWYFATP
jgi:hypothetical protein